MMKASGAKRRRLEEGEEGDLLEDRISSLPDGVLGDIVSLLPTKDGARTQVLSSRWRPLWRAAPFNLDLRDLSIHVLQGLPLSEISRILSSHPGPGRRFSIPWWYFTELGHRPTATLDSWLRSPALDNLQELEFRFGYRGPQIPLPPSVRRFSSTLRFAYFSGCRGFPDGSNTGALLHFPVLRQLSLLDVTISESSLNSLLAGCPVLQSLLLSLSVHCSRVRIVSPTLRSVSVIVGPESSKRQWIIIGDAPCLERLLLFPSQDSPKWKSMEMVITAMSAPKLHILGVFSRDSPRLKLGSTVLQGSRLVSSMTMVPSVKILALVYLHLSLDMVMDVMRCFPCLEKLYIKTTMAGEKNVWCHKYRNLVSTLDIPLKKIVLLNYRGNKSHVNFAKFFVLNARLLESMVFEVEGEYGFGSEWVEKQHKLLQIKNKASRMAQFDFVYPASWTSWYPTPLHDKGCEQAHDLLTTDPFVRFGEWGKRFFSET